MHWTISASSVKHLLGYVLRKTLLTRCVAHICLFFSMVYSLQESQSWVNCSTNAPALKLIPVSLINYIKCFNFWLAGSLQVALYLCRLILGCFSHNMCTQTSTKEPLPSQIHLFQTKTYYMSCLDMHPAVCPIKSCIKCCHLFILSAVSFITTLFYSIICPTCMLQVTLPCLPKPCQMAFVMMLY